MQCPRGHGLAVVDMPDAHLYTRQEAKDVPNARHALYVLARTGDTWQDVATTGSIPSGSVRMSPPLGQTPVDKASLSLREP